VLTAGAGAICYFVCKKIPLEGIPAIVVNGIIGSVIAVSVFVIGNCFLPEFKDAVEFTLRVTGMDKIVKKLGKGSKD
jgi:hypothetical protein